MPSDEKWEALRLELRDKIAIALCPTAKGSICDEECPSLKDADAVIDDLDLTTKEALYRLADEPNAPAIAPRFVTLHPDGTSTWAQPLSEAVRAAWNAS